MRTRHVVGALVGVIACVGMGSSVLAGEITGNGKATGMDGHARSECGFSGLEDNPEAPPMPGTPDPAVGKRRHTQTPHLVWFDVPPEFGGPEEPFYLYPPPGAPGTDCNPTKAHG